MIAVFMRFSCIRTILSPQVSVRMFKDSNLFDLLLEAVPIDRLSASGKYQVLPRMMTRGVMKTLGTIEAFRSRLVQQPLACARKHGLYLGDAGSKIIGLDISVGLSLGR